MEPAWILPLAAASRATRHDTALANWTITEILLMLDRF
jgi:hypothetical protein